MSISSMTGFARDEFSIENYNITIDLKSVNHRYKDVRIKYPHYLSHIEFNLKKIIENEFKRGSIDCYINVKKSQTLISELNYNKDKFLNFIDELKKIENEKNINLSLNSTDIFRNEFVMEEDNFQEEIAKLILEKITGVCEGLKKSRAEEGAKLKKILQSHLELYLKGYEFVKKEKGNYQDALKQKFLDKYKEEFESLKIDENRFNQELIYYLEKLDIDEEINRISSHVLKLNSLLDSKDKSIGRELDFYMQELNRETNTIGSKSGSVSISDQIVQMKVNLEKLREQSLNIE